MIAALTSLFGAACGVALQRGSSVCVLSADSCRTNQRCVSRA